jgi:hypothetical protein
MYGAAVGGLSSVLFFVARQRLAECMKSTSDTAEGAIVESIVRPFFCSGPDIEMLFSRAIAIGGVLVAAGGLTVGLAQGK